MNKLSVELPELDNILQEVEAASKKQKVEVLTIEDKPSSSKLKGKKKKKTDKGKDPKDSKRGNVPLRHGIGLSKSQFPQTFEDVKAMKRVPYASVIGNLMYAMLCTRPDICYIVGIMSRYQSNPGQEHWAAIKGILKYLRRTKDYFIVYGCDQLSVVGYTDSDFQTDKDDRKSTSGMVFMIGDGAVIWRSAKQKSIVDSTTKAEYLAASEQLRKVFGSRNS
ncbi:secreted RxLR effector protein 161-like [Telopea speciosissima]|uniref:secreted RxLR effector protein 161-like n=1 Tax=Telopea speciosissima TaxID=54955 RepID=UPI001CC3925E|nr:secreted RxLR effector protein 161-like [Telopea speciosissima]